MISDLFALSILLLVVVFGVTRPSIALCGVIWVDNYRPQELSISFLQGQPLSAVITSFFLLTLVLNAKKVKVPSNGLYHFLIIFFLIWITFTTTNAVYPEIAWFKFDAAFKTILIAYFIPFVLVQKKDIEALIWFCIASFGTLSFYAGVKTLLGGGGYNINLIGNAAGSFWSEGSTLATMCAAIIPVCIAALHTKIAKEILVMKMAAMGYAFASILAVIGTQARAGLVCLAVYTMLLARNSKKKFSTAIIICLIPLVIAPFVPEAWYERMSSISSQENATSDTSAMGRVVVWRWTLDYVAENPLGGGFYAYRLNAGQLDKYTKGNEVSITTPYPKAWHSILFEVLGTQGIIGFLCFMSILAHAYLVNVGSQKKTSRNETSPFLNNLPKALNISLLVYCAGGLFVNIAFYPWIYYVYGLSIACASLIKKEVMGNLNSNNISSTEKS